MSGDPAQRVLFADLVAGLPPEWPDAGLLAALQERVATAGSKIVVLDDDPTGTQTVHDVLVLTEWSLPTLRRALGRNEVVVFILTNSRSLPLAAAQAMNREIARNLGAAARECGCTIEVISRSDSTLRGHFPGEVDALRQELEASLGIRYDGRIIIPFLEEAGRFTAHNIHWVREGEWLTPAGQTEFARDATFGYRSSDLRVWVEEKTGGDVPAAGVTAVTLDDIRRGGPQRVTQVLMGVTNWGVAVVNAMTYQDMAVFVAGLLDAESQGKRFLFRTAASFVLVRGGITRQGLLGADQLLGDAPPERGGLVVVGSYIQKSTEQLRLVQALPGMVSLELNVGRLLDGQARVAEIEHVTAAMNRLLDAHDVVVFTSRDLVTGADRDENLRIGQAVSDALVQVVGGLARRPRFLVAKGGITSSDVATRALGIRQARVLGQIAKAVPVWQCGDESRFPGLAYVVFPGNVGGPETLAQVVQTLRSPAIAGGRQQ